LIVSPDPSVPPPMVEEADDWKPKSTPRDVREELTTLEARVVPVRFPAGAEPVMLPVRLPVAVVKKRLVVEALVAKKLVVVAEVPVALTKVKFCRVVDDVTKRLVVVAPPLIVSPDPSVPPPMVEEADDWKPKSTPRDVREELTTLEARVVPVRFPAGAEPVMLPVRLPVAVVKKRLVVEALVAKKLVVVAEVPVALTKVKLCRVVEPRCSD